MCDLIESGGVVGGPHLPDHTHKAVDLVFCNPDLIWKSDFDRPRLGQGAFREAFQAVFKVTGLNLLCIDDDQTFLTVFNRSAIPVYPIWKTNGSDLQVRGASLAGTTARKILC